MYKLISRVKPITRMVLTAVVFGLLIAAADSENFLEQRRKFRDEIKNKVETRLDSDGNYVSVIFEGEQGRYDFKVTPEDRARLKKYASSYFSTTDDALLDRIVDEMNSGHYAVYKEYHDDGVNLKVLFLSPKARYWKWLTDVNGIEKMFHTYNFSVGLHQPDRNNTYVVLQTEGAFFGISQAVTLPLIFTADEKKRTLSFHMPDQKEINRAMSNMEPLKEGRTSPEDKFIDAARTHPFFQQKKNGEYAVSDDDILKLYRETIKNMDEECPVKESTGHWTVQDDYPYLVVDYSLKTRVNVDAFIPPSLRFLSGTIEDIAQSISDEVSVKYLPLSMKNLRDFTQEWTRTGGPE
jgi:hypothetical protein